MKQPDAAPVKHGQEIFLADYTPPAYLISDIELDIDIRPDLVRVNNLMQVRRNPASADKKARLHLKGQAQQLLSVSVNGKALKPADYTLTDHDLTFAMPDKATVEIVSTLNPYTNTSLFGLYKSGTMVSTQCEPEGFRRITYHPDRPDVMSKFTVRIEADRHLYPVLLANGNLIQSGKIGTKGKDEDRHYAVWEDPFPKPSYLFAMVAGKLDRTQSSFKTKSGRKVLLEIYVEPGRLNETACAMIALKKSMKWDEDVFGLEYDLDRFMIVGTPFFNMGAMENKGLNIFNEKTLLGDVKTATDDALYHIEKVVGHEYFHNWTGNRITCRDWFQLSLKEGLTVFREQEFSSDMNSRAVERLMNIRMMRSIQFAEDAGMLAHPIRPDRYQEIDNFYTYTVYEKGSEVIRMIHTLVGAKGFHKGMKLYVKRHDGQAATCDDFVAAMADANKLDLSQFKLWYSQAGTPTLDVASKYDAKAKTLKLTVKQSCPPTPGQPKKKPMHMPLSIGLLDAVSGKDLIGTRVLQVTKAKEEFTITNVKTKPVLSLLRDFSAPVYLNYAYTDEELVFLMAHDSDPFCRWEAGFKLSTKYLLALAGGDKPPVDKLVEAFRKILNDGTIDPAFKSMLLTLPSESELGGAQRAAGQPVAVDALYKATDTLRLKMAKALYDDFVRIHGSLKVAEDAIDGASAAKRSLRNLCLSYICMPGVVQGDKKWLQLAFDTVATSANMTDQAHALRVLARSDSPLYARALTAFERRWRKSSLIMDDWLRVQAGARMGDVLADVQRLMQHKHFDLKNPNTARSLLGVFAINMKAFHAKDGSGYRFIADMIIKADPVNPFIASTLAKNFTTWRDYDSKRQQLMLKELKRLSKVKLSVNAMEIVSKSLANPLADVKA